VTHGMQWLSVLVGASAVVAWSALRRGGQAARLRSLPVPSRRARRPRRVGRPL
jgi:hypothetical protein